MDAQERAEYMKRYRARRKAESGRGAEAGGAGAQGDYWAKLREAVAGGIADAMEAGLPEGFGKTRETRETRERFEKRQGALAGAKEDIGAMQAMLSEPPPKPRLFDAYFLPEGDGEGQPAPPADTKTIPLWPEQAGQGERGAALEPQAQAGPGLCQECGAPLSGSQRMLCASRECYNNYQKARKRRERAAKKASGGGA